MIRFRKGNNTATCAKCNQYPAMPNRLICDACANALVNALQSEVAKIKRGIAPTAMRAWGKVTMASDSVPLTLEGIEEIQAHVERYRYLQNAPYSAPGTWAEMRKLVGDKVVDQITGDA